MSMGLGWLGSFLAFFTLIGDQFDNVLETKPVETFRDFFYSFEYSSVTSGGQGVG